MNHDIDKILELFADDVEYWETPHKKLSSKDELRKEWEAINKQREIDLSIEMFGQNDGSYSVLWKLNYNSDEGDQDWAGTYLIKLNDKNLCTYFHHTGERK